MTQLEGGLPAVVETPAGAVVADKVVLTCGPWLAARARSGARCSSSPRMSSRRRPRPSARRHGVAFGRPFADARTSVHYGQRTGDDRLVFGRGGGRLGFAGSYHAGALPRRGEIPRSSTDLHALCRFRGWPPSNGQWGGPVTTQHGTPWVGALGSHGNVHYGAGIRATGCARRSSSVGRWPLSCCSRRRLRPLAARLRPALVPPARTGALARPAPCAPPSIAASSRPTRGSSPTQCRGWSVAASTSRCPGDPVAPQIVTDTSAGGRRRRL